MVKIKKKRLQGFNFEQDGKAGSMDISLGVDVELIEISGNNIYLFRGFDEMESGVNPVMLWIYRSADYRSAKKEFLKELKEYLL
jgi:hypothetical protein